MRYVVGKSFTGSTEFIMPCIRCTDQRYSYFYRPNCVLKRFHQFGMDFHATGDGSAELCEKLPLIFGGVFREWNAPAGDLSISSVHFAPRLWWK